MKSKSWRIVCLATAVVLLLTTFTACGSGTSNGSGSATTDPGAAASGEPVYGGHLIVREEGDPPTLDPTMEGAVATFMIVRYIWEGLATMDANFEVTGMLAKDWDINDDFTEFVFHLREGVNFHDGTVMTSADVVASLNRWYGRSEIAQKNLGENAVFQATDPLTVTIKTTVPARNLLNIMAYWEDGFYVVPKSTIDAAGDDEITEAIGYIGTGPYKFEEYIPDNYLRLTKFEDYTAIEGGSDGMGGTKLAYLDTIDFVPVKEATTAIAGLQAGDYDVGSVSSDLIDQVSSQPNLHVVPIDSGEFPCVIFNKTTGPMADLKLRQAMQALTNGEDILGAAFNPEFYSIHPGFMPAFTAWNTGDLGAEYYNQADIEKAKQLIAESSYNGEAIVFYTTQTYDYMYKNAMVLVSEMKDAGLNVDLQVVDWATLGEIRSKDTGWDIFSGGFTLKLTPLLIAWMGDAWPGKWVSPEKTRLLTELGGVLGTDEQYAVWEELTKLAYEEVPVVYFGEIRYAYALNNRVHGDWVGSSPYYWNTWVED
ncbi:MAG: ABC transporter substrate-binding protein [Clostridiales Family XIII bacterium]|jgi:peptide/nickel transport system substrate-binding protein|nr:ABC transporter substrate-binding protein [Clostridiales Family XIII bacterium]